MEELDLASWRYEAFPNPRALSDFLLSAGARWGHIEVDEDGRQHQHRGYEVMVCAGKCHQPTLAGLGGADRFCGRPGCK